MRSTVVVALAFIAASITAVGACSSDEDLAHSTSAQLVSPDLVIADVYAGGGLSGATYNRDFVVVFNRGAATAPLTGVTLFYASATGNFQALSSTAVLLGAGSIPAGGSLLVTMISGATGTAIPDGDINNTAMNMGAGGGKLALASTSLAGCGSAGMPCNPNNWIDLVGWGTAGSPPSQSEGTRSSEMSTNAKWLARATNGCGDTGNNSVDVVAGTVALPRDSSTTPTPCTSDMGTIDLSMVTDLSGDLSGPDLAQPPRDLSGVNILLNEVKWNPSLTDNGQEYIELLGNGQVPSFTYVISVDGDGTAVGRINFVHDISNLSFGTNGLMLLKGATSSFAGADAATTVVPDTALNSTPLQNGTESVLVISAPAALTMVAGTTKLASLSDYQILDSIAAADTTGTTFGGAVLAACPMTGKSPVDGASRIAGNTSAQDPTAWYAGQTFGQATDQYLDDVTACSGATSAPATWSMTPGRPNDAVPPPDLLPPPPADLAVVTDFSIAQFDLSNVNDFTIPQELPPDLSPVTPRNTGGCSFVGTRAPSGAWIALLAMTALWLMRRRAED